MKRPLQNSVKNIIQALITEDFTNKEDMKTLLKKALDNAIIVLEKQVPQTKKKTETISILDVSPSELIRFMKTNNIPKDAYFSGRDNGYDSWDDIVLAWEIDIPTSEQEKSDYRNYRFHDIAFKRVYETLTTNGYNRLYHQPRNRISYKRTRKGLSSITVFDNKSVYEMYIDADWDKLIDYYSLYFKEDV